MNGITFDYPTRTLVTGMRDCVFCSNRQEGWPGLGREVRFADKPCAKCKGTGKRGNGKCRGCKDYSDTSRWDKRPVGMVPDHDRPEDNGPCRSCDGAGETAETLYGHIDADTMTDIIAVCPVRVYPNDRELTRGEEVLGFIRGAKSLFSSVDYGRSWDRHHADADAFLAEVTEKIRTSSPQGIKIADKQTGLVDDHIGVLLARNGFTVIGVTAEMAAAAETARTEVAA